MTDYNNLLQVLQQITTIFYKLSPADYNPCLQVLHQTNVSPQYHKEGTTDGYLDPYIRLAQNNMV